MKTLHVNSKGSKYKTFVSINFLGVYLDDQTTLTAQWWEREHGCTTSCNCCNLFWSL